MKYARPPFPPAVWKKLCRVASALNYSMFKGEKWRLLDMLLDYADMHPNLFRKR